jgi:hypothetical protein
MERCPLILMGFRELLDGFTLAPSVVWKEEGRPPKFRGGRRLKVEQPATDSDGPGAQTNQQASPIGGRSS